MRSIFYENYGEPSKVLQLRDVPDLPAPAAGEVLIRVHARPVHPGDLIGVRGRYRAPGNTADVAPGGARPGFEGAGVIEQVGHESKELKPGMRVAFFPAKWAWGEYVIAPAQFVTQIPDAVSDGNAAQLHVNPLTASMLLRAIEGAGAQEGDVIVLSAAGSAVAKLVMTMALRKRLSVIGVVRTKAGVASLQPAFKAATIVTTEDQDWRDQIRAASAGKPVRVVVDAVGGAIASDLVSLLGDGGSFIGYGDLSGHPISIPALSLPVRGLTMKGVSVGGWAGLPEPVRIADVRTAIELAQGDPHLFSVAAEYDLARITDAVVHAEQPGRSGAVLLTSVHGGQIS